MTPAPHPRGIKGKQGPCFCSASLCLWGMGIYRSGEVNERRRKGKRDRCPKENQRGNCFCCHLLRLLTYMGNVDKSATPDYRILQEKLVPVRSEHSIPLFGLLVFEGRGGEKKVELDGWRQFRKKKKAVVRDYEFSARGTLKRREREREK